MAALPTGTVTFLFTDVEGSTRLWEQQPEGMRQALARHDAIIEGEVERYGGNVVRPRGEGDSRFAVFARATDAIPAAAAIQRALHAEAWPAETPLRVRMAIHTGEADLRDGDHYGSAVNRCARLRAIAHGGQVLLSRATYNLVRDSLPGQVGLRDLGEHRLSDLTLPEHVFQVLIVGVAEDFPPLRSLATLPHNLPNQLTSFVGRTRQLAELSHALTQTRLLTLTGTGGCGKTRLALHVAADALASYPDGVWLVEFAPLADPTLVPSAVAAALALREQPGRPLTDTVIEALRTKRLLLVMDNCEHLIDATARLANAVLRACPAVRILATSREALGIQGEVSHLVPSLMLPPEDAPLPLAQLAEYEAVTLFIERARAVQPALTLTVQNVAAVAQVCRRLDGIPLALELAAARTRALTLQQIAARLDQRFRLLTGGSRAALPRQQTLRALVDWSYDLLPEPERRVFHRLSVFAGGWALEAAEAVCGAEEIEREMALDLLLRLVDKSLVLAEEGPGDAERYRLLETIRQYGRERLVASGEEAAVQARHAAHYLALAEELDPERAVIDDAVWSGRLDSELDNMRAALQWFATAGDIESLLRLASALEWFWFFQGYAHEGERWLAEGLASREGASPRVRAHALSAAGMLAYRGGDHTRAEALLQESVALFQQLGDRHGLAWSLHSLSNVSRAQGKYAETDACIEEGLALCRALGDVPLRGTQGTTFPGAPLTGLLILQQGIAAREQGDPDRAQPLLEEALAIAQANGQQIIAAVTLASLCAVALDRKDYGRAHACLRESLTATRQMGNVHNLTLALESAASLAAVEGRFERALRLMGAAAALRERHAMAAPPIWRSRIEDTLARARSRLDAVPAAAAWEHGRALSPEQAIAEALDEGNGREVDLDR